MRNGQVVETVQSQLRTYRNVDATVEVMDSTAALSLRSVFPIR